MMLFKPPRMPCAMVGARTVMPRTTPLYSRTRRPCTSKVVETMMGEDMAMGAASSEWGDRSEHTAGKIAGRLPCLCRPRAGIIPPFHDHTLDARIPAASRAHARCPEDDHGGHGRGVVPLRRRSHARQPQGVSGTRAFQRVRRRPAHRGRAVFRPRPAAVARARRSDRVPRGAPVGSPRGDQGELARAPGRLSPARSRGGDVRGPHDAVGRRHHRRVRRLSSARPHVRGRESGLRPRRRVSQSGGEPAALARGGRLYRGRHRGRTAYPARGVERAPDPGPEPPADVPLAALLGGAHRGTRHGGLRGGSGRGAGRRGALMELRSKVPGGPLAEKWQRHRADLKLVNPANKLKHHIIVVGSGLAGASAAASLAELGYEVTCFCFQDSPRRAHSIAAQGGINAAKNYPNDGDSVFRLFYDTVKGGDFRARESNVYRLSQISLNIIDQCVAQGVPFAREYGGMLANRSFGGAQVSRTFYARGQTGQQLLLGAYQALCRQIGLGTVKMFPRTEMLDVVLIGGHAKGIVVRNLVTGAISSHAGDAVVLATGGYGNVFFLSTNAKGCNVTATWRAYKQGAAFANPCYTQIHPTCIPVSSDHQSKLTLMSESLRNDGRVWVPKTPGDKRPPHQIPENERDYFLERKYPAFGNLVPR